MLRVVRAPGPNMADPHIVLAGQRLVLRPERALWWSARRALIVADVHLGKDAHFRSQGLAIPQGNTRRDLNRLQRLVTDHEARELWVLGDLFHTARICAIRADIDRWREAVAECRVVLVRGNHDRRTDLPESWRVDVVDTQRVDDIDLRHAPAACVGAQISGHIHPTVRLDGGRHDALRSPVYWLRGEQLVLPAFGSFTGGYNVLPEAHHRIFAVGPHSVIEIDQRIVARS